MRYKEKVNKMNNIIPEISVIIPVYNADDSLDINTFKYIMDKFESYDMVVWNWGNVKNDKLSWKNFTKNYILPIIKKNGPNKKICFLPGKMEKVKIFIWVY